MDFREAWEKTMGWEGGGVLHHNRNDPGGLTKWGISQRAFPNEDIAGLHFQRAQLLAYTRYWAVVHAGSLPPALRWPVFDMAFNAGPATSTKLLQRSINLCNESSGNLLPHLVEDGDVGPITLAALKRHGAAKLTTVFEGYRAKHYITLAENSPTPFIYGWLRRARGEANG